MRYFVAFFVAVDKDGEHQQGHIGFVHKSYPPFRALSKQIAAAYDFDRAIITNMIELNEADYNNWLLEEEGDGGKLEDFV